MKFRVSRLLILVTCLLAVVFVNGCRKSKVPGLVPAEGIIYYNGRPLGNASVTFTQKETNTDSRFAIGIADINGKFTVRTLGEKGILPGEYLISASKYIPNEGRDSVKNWKKKHSEGVPEPAQEEETLDVVFALPEKYKRPKTSRLEISIGPEGNREIKIEMED